LASWHQEQKIKDGPVRVSNTENSLSWSPSDQYHFFFEALFTLNEPDTGTTLATDAAEWYKANINDIVCLCT